MTSTQKSRLHEQYQTAVRPKLKEQFGYANVHQIPRIEKVVVSVGIGSALREPAIIETVQETLKRITGQKPLMTKAKKSIASFKLREGAVIGAKVTLRGKRMYEFLDKLINVVFPRVRDFRGVPFSVMDKQGNASIGFAEHVVFPEIAPDEVENTHGVQVTITTTAKSDDEGKALLVGLGFPFTSEKVEKEKRKISGKEKKKKSGIAGSGYAGKA